VGVNVLSGRSVHRDRSVRAPGDSGGGMRTWRSTGVVSSAGLAFTLLLGGCSLLSEFSPGAEDASVEVVLIRGECLLTVREVLAGLHPVWVFSQTPGGSAQIIASDGTVVFEGDALQEERGPGGGTGGTAPATSPTGAGGQPQGPVQLDAGTYRVECTAGTGEESSAELLVR
jgi:hypothetical protein